MAVIFRYKLYHHQSKNVHKISSLNSYRRYTQENACILLSIPELVENRSFFEPVTIKEIVIFMISNGNRTEWSPIQSVIIQVITKSDDRAAEFKLNACMHYTITQATAFRLTKYRKTLTS